MKSEARSPKSESLAAHGLRLRRVVSLGLLGLALASGLAALARAGDYNLDTAYRNLWFNPGPPGGPFTNYFSPVVTNGSTPVYGGECSGQ